VKHKPTPQAIASGWTNKHVPLEILTETETHAY